MRTSLALAAGFLVAVLVQARPDRASGEPAPADCRVPNELIQDDPKLPATAARFHAKEPLTIVAIGGASTAGTAAGSGGANAYPKRLEEALRRRHPGIAITVLNKGIARQTTTDMVNRFASDVVPNKPTLVIWETGTIDAVRGNDVDQFADALLNGIAALRQHNYDVMLIDMQYNPSTGSVIDFAPYLEALKHAADFENVYLFQRFEMMRYWTDSGVFDLVNVPRERRVSLAEEVYRCIGENLADAIDYGAQ
jgi:hypothetical protein